MDYYSKISKSYNDLYSDEQMAKLVFISSLINFKGLLLDVGCGTGLALNFFKVKSVGIDNSYLMLKKAQANVVKANAENLPFKNNIFDTVISVTSIQNFKNPEKAVMEMKRVSTNNIVITIMKKSKKLDLIRSLIKKHFKSYKEYNQEKDVAFVISSILSC